MKNCSEQKFEGTHGTNFTSDNNSLALFGQVSFCVEVRWDWGRKKEVEGAPVLTITIML